MALLMHPTYATIASNMYKNTDEKKRRQCSIDNNVTMRYRFDVSPHTKKAEGNHIKKTDAHFFYTYFFLNSNWLRATLAMEVMLYEKKKNASKPRLKKYEKKKEDYGRPPSALINCFLFFFRFHWHKTLTYFFSFSFERGQVKWMRRLFSSLFFFIYLFSLMYLNHFLIFLLFSLTHFFHHQLNMNTSKPFSTDQKRRKKNEKKVFSK